MILELMACAMLMKPLPEWRSKMIWEPAQIIYDNGTNLIAYDITDEERALLERCVMSEAGGESYDVQEAVATVILNRVFAPDKFNATITGVITAEGQFSTHDNGEPTKSVKLAVHNALQYYGGAYQCIPSQIYYFRQGHYHEWALDYAHIGNLYFSAPKSACIN